MNRIVIFIILLNLITLGSIGIAQPKRELEIYFYNEKYIINAYDILKITPDSVEKVGSFPLPTFSLLRNYRKNVQTDLELDKDKISFYNNLKDIGSFPGVSHVIGDRIWVGFSFYEDEFLTGYGGIGFFEPVTGKIGILRHPAVINQSVSSLTVTTDKIIAKTNLAQSYASESSTRLIIIDKHTLNARNYSISGDFDFSMSPNDLTDGRIQQLVVDSVLVENKNHKWNKIDHNMDLELEQFMLNSYEQETNIRLEAVQNSQLLLKKTIKLDSLHTTYNIQSENYRPYFMVNGLPYLNKRLFSKILIFLPRYATRSLVCYFAAFPDRKRVTHWHQYSTEKGNTIEYQTSKFWFKILLSDFDFIKINDAEQQSIRLFKSVALDVEVLGIR